MNAPRTPQVPLLELDLLRTLVAIAEGGSFSAAAETVLRTPSAVSMQVKKIEDLLGRPVFVRDSRSVRLTVDGEYLVEHARRMLALNREAVAHFVMPDLRGEVRLGAADDVAERYLPEMLCRFAQTHPGVTVNVIVERTAQLVALHQEGRLDLALISCDGAVRDTGAEVVSEEALVWVMRAGGVAVEQDPLPVSFWDETCAWRRGATAALERAGRPWRLAFQSAHISGQKAAILADLAVAPIPRSSIGGEIVEVPERYGLPALPTSPLGLLSPETPDPPVAAAADHLRASFAKAKRG